MFSEKLFGIPVTCSVEGRLANRSVIREWGNGGCDYPITHFQSKISVPWDIESSVLNSEGVSLEAISSVGILEGKAQQPRLASSAGGVSETGWEVRDLETCDSHWQSLATWQKGSQSVVTFLQELGFLWLANIPKKGWLILCVLRVTEPIVPRIKFHSEQEHKWKNNWFFSFFLIRFIESLACRQEN